MQDRHHEEDVLMEPGDSEEGVGVSFRYSRFFSHHLVLLREDNR